MELAFFYWHKHIRILGTDPLRVDCCTEGGFIKIKNVKQKNTAKLENQKSFNDDTFIKYQDGYGLRNWI